MMKLETVARNLACIESEKWPGAGIAKSRNTFRI